MCSACPSNRCVCSSNCSTHPGEVVTRERLVQVLWPKGVVDFDNSLNAVVRKLRAVLGDDSETPRYIETLPRIGYRFVGKMEAPVERAGGAPAVPRRGSAIRPARCIGLALLCRRGRSRCHWCACAAEPDAAAGGSRRVNCRRDAAPHDAISARTSSI